MTMMIERVVAANKRAWDEWPEPITTANLAQVREAAARAAIATMREPTDGMVEAGDIPDCDAPHKPAGAVWRTMIDAALEEKL